MQLFSMLRLRAVAILFGCVAVLFLAGCAGSLPGISKQGKQGGTEAAVFYNDDGTLKEARISDYKDKQSVELSIEKPDGTKVVYKASGVTGSKQAEVRGDVEKAISGDVKDAVPTVGKIITDIVGSAP